MDSGNAKIKTQIRHIGHEIRNQLSICDIYSEILRKHLDKENIKNESINNALDCIQNAIKLIGNNLLELKSVGEIVIHTCDSDKLIKSCLDMASVYVKDKKIEFVSELAPNIKILADENKLQCCIINIIKNAVEAIDSKGVISITSKQDKEFLAIKISNNGNPIPKDKIDEIFKDGYTTKTTGSGVGLYLCRKNLNAVNGTLELTETNNTKTEFTIKIPLST